MNQYKRIFNFYQTFTGIIKNKKKEKRKKFNSKNTTKKRKKITKMNDITNNLTLGKTHRWKKNRIDYGDLKKKLYEVASSVAHFREDTTRPFYTDFQK